MSIITTEGLFIAGEWDSGSTGETVTVVNPATEESIGEVPQASVDDVERAIQAAHRAFADGDGSWPSMKPSERSRILHVFCDVLESRLDDLRHLAVVEMGTPMSTADGAQILGGLQLLRAWAEAAASFAFEEPLSPVRTAANIGQVLVRKEPVGVVAAITPFNAPLLINLWKIAPALAIGNTVVLKPSPYTPFSALILAEAAIEAGLPPGVLNIVTGERDAAELLTTHPLVDMVSFTGSEGVGRQIAAQAGASLKRVVLELGGKSALVVFGDVDLDHPGLIRAAVNGCTSRAGQTCAATTRILVEHSIHDVFVDRVSAALSGVIVGDPSDPRTAMGPVIRETQRRRIEEYIEIGKQEGAEVVVGGGRPPTLERGYFVEPTLFASVRNEMRIAQEEIFGPVSVVIPFQDANDAVRLANDSRYGLSGAVWSQDRRRAMEVASRLRTGQVHINGGCGQAASGPPPFGAPFGGFKNSGLGREHGVAGTNEFVEFKTVTYPIG